MLRKTFKIIFKTFLLLLAVTGLYALAVFTLPLITVNNDYKNEPQGIKIVVLSNGVHTDIVVPAKNDYKDWTLAFPSDSFDVKDPLYNFIAFGWGDKGFYLYTPEWSDLKASTALKATCGLGGTAMHVTYRKERKKESEHCKIFTLTKEQYETLVQFIDDSFVKEKDQVLKINHPGYGNLDRFYEAKGNYSLFKTCNIWTNRALKKTGIKTGFWCPFAKGLMNSLKQ